MVASLVAKLQLYVQQVNSALEETSQQILVSMPRIIADAQVCLPTFLENRICNFFFILNSESAGRVNTVESKNV